MISQPTPEEEVSCSWRLTYTSLPERDPIFLAELFQTTAWLILRTVTTSAQEWFSCMCPSWIRHHIILAMRQSLWELRTMAASKIDEYDRRMVTLCREVESLLYCEQHQQCWEEASHLPHNHWSSDLTSCCEASWVDWNPNHSLQAKALRDCSKVQVFLPEYSSQESL